MARVLLTGPVRGLEHYAEAARSVGWEPLELPLLEIRERPLELAARPDWICLSSSNALFALEPHRDALALVPCAVVGHATAERLVEAGFRLELEPAENASRLADALIARVAAADRGATRVLWPHGSQARELGDRLAWAGFDVDRPVVYETLARESVRELPDAEAIFFASPSAVERYLRIADETRTVPAAIAIGETTARALRTMAAGRFASTARLETPDPAALGVCLERWRS